MMGPEPELVTADRDRLHVRSAISDQKSVSCPRRISCHGALRRLRDILVRRDCCLRQKALLISILDGNAPLGGYGQSSNAQSSTQLVPGAEDAAFPTVSPGPRADRYRVMQGGRLCRSVRFTRGSLSRGWSPRSARFRSKNTSATSCWARPFSSVHPSDGRIQHPCPRGV